ncbi:integrin alpha-X [Grus japonensis]|uniref:Integrin alpha-X n=1 Tax=Grus japonensis TaxID=30415 RepID=A0ABC9Y0X7_GRUJA
MHPWVLLALLCAGCSMEASDIVFLMDGSSSILPEDFDKMKTFITRIMSRFENTDTRFSSISTLHFDFAAFARLSPVERVKEVLAVAQSKGTTHTASAIRTVVRQLFTQRNVARAGAHRVLIVVTDGQKFGDTLDYGQVIPEAAHAGIIRYAIGVGSAFVDADAVQELHTIASEPTQDHVFRVDNFDALQGIQDQLQEKIFAIEGTQSAHSSSFQLEMAQEGFSALLTPEGPVLGAVGAYDWSGGVFVYGAGGETAFVNASRAAGDMNDAYLGYAAEPLSLGGSRALALGAPRYRHVGRLLLFLLRGPRRTWDLLADAPGPQVGSYFGASLCALDADGDGAAEVLLVGAPMFYGAGSGGRVAVCALGTKGGRLRCQEMLRGQPGHPLGRFGASLARLGDVDGDRWPNVAVGAPLEDEERGAVYVFRGTRGGVASQYSQRISGAQFSSGPRYFGQAISGGQDLTGDRLPDVAVGAQGQVLLLRSQPLLKVRVTVAFQPQEIPAAAFDCQEEEAPKGEVAKAKICFLTTKKTPDNFGETSQKSSWTPRAAPSVPKTPQKCTQTPQAPPDALKAPQKPIWPPKAPPDVLKAPQISTWPPKAPPDALKAPQISTWPPKAPPDALKAPQKPTWPPKAPPDALKAPQISTWPPKAPPDALKAPQKPIWPPKAPPDALKLPKPHPDLPSTPEKSSRPPKMSPGHPGDHAASQTHS